MSEQHDAHCHIAFQTWPKPAKGKKRVMVMSYRKIRCLTWVNGVPAISLHTGCAVTQCLYVHEVLRGERRIIRI